MYNIIFVDLVSETMLHIVLILVYNVERNLQNVKTCSNVTLRLIE